MPTGVRRPAGVDFDLHARTVARLCVHLQRHLQERLRLIAQRLLAARWQCTKAVSRRRSLQGRPLFLLAPRAVSASTPSPRAPPRTRLADNAFERFPEVIPALATKTALERVGEPDDIAPRPAPSTRPARVAEAADPDHRGGGRRWDHRPRRRAPGPLLGRYHEGRLRIRRAHHRPATRGQRARRAAARAARPRLARTAPGAPLGSPAHRLHPPTPAYAPTSSSRSAPTLALDGVRWRHPVRLVRLRSDLQPTDLKVTDEP